MARFFQVEVESDHSEWALVEQTFPEVRANMGLAALEKDNQRIMLTLGVLWL